jgi:hypothetical protein
MSHPLCVRSLAVAALLAVTGPAIAQTLHVAGASLRTFSNSYTRGPAGFNAGELIQKFDADDLRGFGVEAAFPGMQVVRGVTLPIKDFGSSTPNSLYDLALYTESPTTPDYPDLQNPLHVVTGLTAGFGTLTWSTIQFQTPVLVPVGRDLFVGVRIPAMTSTFGGVRLMLISSSTSSTFYDVAGPGMPSTPPELNSYRLYRDLTTNAVTYSARGQYLMDLLTRSPGGMPGSLSLQGSYPPSQVTPGATTMLSGLHPDAASPPLNPGRADEVSFVFDDWSLAAGSPVMFLGAFADFGPVVPLDQYAPGSRGGSCLDPAAVFVLGFASHGSLGTQCAFVTTIPAPVRPLLGGVQWTQQAIAFEGATGTLRGTQCGKQKF